MIRFSQKKSFTKEVELAFVPHGEGKDAASLFALSRKDKKEYTRVAEATGHRGKPGEVVTLYPKAGAGIVHIWKIGNPKELSLRAWKKMVGQKMQLAQSLKKSSVGMVLPKFMVSIFGVETLIAETVIAIHEGVYAFDRYRSEDDKYTEITDVVFVSKAGLSESAFKKGVAKGEAIAAGVTLTRDLGNIPPTEMTPQYLVNTAKELASEFESISVTAYDEKGIENMNMGCLLGVSWGSIHEPAFIDIRYAGGKKDEAPIVLVGKGITFDSGGLSLKPSSYMMEMKFDMLGAATVFGIVKAAAALGIKKNIVGLVPTCENMPGGESYRPDDILTAMNGKTVLIENTDAEGRLILADALCYAHTLKPKQVIDFATLTGACMVALGNERSGLFSQDEKIVKGLDLASKEVGEQLWRLPLGPEYSEAMKSEVADIKNTGGVGGGGYGGASTAAAFLEFFTKDYSTEEATAYPWAHIDLSCSHFGGKGKDQFRTGANGFGVQTLVRYLEAL